jgi:N-acylneuraminate cytidylyltransferase
MNIVAIIPARGNSKGLPGKNKKLFCGKPLVAWSIEQANRSKMISSVWVSSDDQEILDISKSYGAETILRPANISGDEATSESAWLHSIQTIENLWKDIDLVIGIQCTSPLRKTKDFDEAIKTFFDQNLDSLFTSCIVKDRLLWNYSNNHHFMSLNYNFQERSRRQKMEKVYLENGSFYVFKPSNFKKCLNRLGGKIGTYVMDHYKRLQIDKIEDFRLCEIVMRGYGLDNN